MASPDGVICVGLFSLSMFGNEVSPWLKWEL